MASPSQLYPQKIDLNNCDKEPIHKLNKVQNHGAVLSFDLETLQVVQCSNNIESFLKLKPEAVIDKSIQDLFGKAIFNDLATALQHNKFTAIPYETQLHKLLLIPHKNENHFILELEQSVAETNTFTYQQQLTEIINQLSNATDEQEMCDLAATLVKDFLQYDRVMIYQFDENWNGEVVSEAREEKLESWLGLHYPATDIPQQARQLFLKQGVRIISEITNDTAYMVPQLSPVTNDVLDLSKSELRAPSSIHIEYLQNMKVGGTLTAAIVYNNTLWGLIACHHYSPKFISYHHRLSCKFLTQVFANQLGLRAFNSSLKKINEYAEVRSALVKQMSANWNITEGLSVHENNLLSLTEASGVAILIDGKLTCLGNTPKKKEILALCDWITKEKQDEVYYTNKLSTEFIDAKHYEDTASGVLHLTISKGKNNKLLWFKPEVLETVDWGGNPNKSFEIDEANARLSPRKSFEKWSEKVKGQSDAWHDYEIAAAKALKESISEIIVEKYDEVMQLNKQLEKAYKELESFSYSVSHDLRAPLRGIDGFAQIIKEDYFDSLDDYGKNALETIISSTEKMNELIDDILHFSGLHQQKMRVGEVDINKLVDEVIALNQTTVLFPNTQIIVQHDLPNTYGDASMLTQLFSNLLNNALKYSAEEEEPVIKIGHQYINGVGWYTIQDNGIGIDMNHEKAVFEIFNRLVDNDKYPGTGIGLAIVKRVVEKHNGQIILDSVLGEQTTFKFRLCITENNE